MANVLQSAQQFFRNKFKDDEGWFRQGRFTPGKQIQQVRQQSRQAPLRQFGPLVLPNIRNQQSRQSVNTMLRDTGNRLKQAVPAFGRMSAFTNPLISNKRLQEYGVDPSDTKARFRDVKTGAKGALTAYGLMNPAVALKSAFAGGILNTGVNAYQNRKQGAPLLSGSSEAFSTGAGRGIANAGTTRLTSELVNQAATKLPFLNPLTSQSLQSGAPIASDSLKQAVRKWASVAGKKLIKSTVLETIIETPIWATLTKGEKESFSEAIKRETIENLAMNTAFAGVDILGDATKLSPILKRSVSEVVQKYKDAPIKQKMGGYIDMHGNIRDGTPRTRDFDTASDVYNNPKSSVEMKTEALSTIENIGRRMFTKKEYKDLTTRINYKPAVLIRAVGEKIGLDVKQNVGYKEPLTIKNLLTGEDSQRGGADFTDRSKPFAQQQRLNVSRLKLSPEAKKVVSAVEGTEPRVRLKNKDIEKLAKEVTGDEKVRLRAGTAEKIAGQLNTRKNVVSLTKEFDALKAGGATRVELEAKMAKIGKFADISRKQGTDVARQFQARKILADELDTPMLKVFKLLDTAGIESKEYVGKAVDVDWNNAKDATDFYRSFVPAKFSEWIDEFRYTNMLSSPKTHITNFVSNTIQSAVQPVRKVAAGGYDWAISGLTGRERTQFAGEAGPFVKKALTSLPKAWTNAQKKIKGEIPLTNLDLKHIPSGNKFMRLYSTPLRVLEAGDAFFQTILGEGQKGALKYRAGKLKTKLGDVELARQAKDYASEVVFRGELNKQGQGWMLNAIDGLTSLIHKTRHSKSGAVRGAGKLLIPFVQTPMNILKQGVEYSPLEFANMVNSGGNTADQLAKATIGSMVMAGAGTIISGGNSTWKTPTGTKEREAFYAAGKQQYSIKIGNKWVSYSKLGPLAYPVAMAGAVHEAIKERGDDMASVTAGKIVAMMGGFFTDQSYMRSVGDIIDAMRGDKYKQTRMMANVPTQLVPFKSFIGWVNRMIDPIYRKVDWSNGIPKAIAQSIQRDIPFASQGLPAYTDPVGDPSKRQFPILNAVSPFNITEEKEEFTGVYNKIVGDRRARKAEKNAEASLLAGAGTREINDKLMFVVDGEVVKLDFGKIADMPASNAMERVKKDKAKFTFIGKLVESGADDVDIDSALKKVGVTREDAEYYNIARNTNDAKSAYVFEALQDVSSREEMMQLLANGRKKINGKLVVADGVVDDLYREGVITYAEKKYLKSLKQNRQGKMTTGRAKGSGKKPPKPRFRKTAPVRVSRIKTTKGRNIASLAKPLNLKVNIKRTQPRVRLKTK